MNSQSESEQTPDAEEFDEHWLKRLFALNAIVAGAGQPLAGNLLYDHHQTDYRQQPPNPILREKRDRFRKAVADRHQMLEVGVNGGHSAYLALASNPDLSFHGVDICEHAYAEPAMRWLQEEFPGRFSFTEGDCLKVLPRLQRLGIRFDCFHIDGAKHTYFNDLLNFDRLASPSGATVIMDDTQIVEVARLWKRCLTMNLIATLPDFPTMHETSTYRHQIGRLVTPGKVKWLVLKAQAWVLLWLHEARLFAGRWRRRLRDRLR